MSDRDKGHCITCGEEVTITAKGVVRVHGPKADRCAGSGLEPREAAITVAPPLADPVWEEAPATPVFAADSVLGRASATSGQASGIIARGLPLAASGRAAKEQQDAAQAFIEGGGDVSGTDPTFRNNLTRPTAGEPLSDDAGVAAFLGEEPHEPEAKPGRWFPSRYDGDCDSCGAAIDEGDEIRADGEGGWQGRECCGYKEEAAEQDTEMAAVVRTPRAERPVIVSTKPPINGNHRYVLPHPDTGKPWTATRATNFNKRASDRFALAQWEMRCVLAGMAVDPGIADKVLELLGDDVLASVKTEKVRLNALVEEAKAATKSGDKASTGTELHKWTEMLDAGTITLDRVPVNHRPIAARYRAVLKASGFTPVPHLIERTTGYAAYGVVGTFDQVMQGPDGKYRMVDKKSGSLQFGQDEMAIQLAVYAHGANRHGIAEWSGEGSAKDPKTWGWVPLTDAGGDPITVEEDWGVIVHMPQDNSGCTLMQVDLATGWRGAELCNTLGEWHKVKSTMVPMEAPGLDDVVTMDEMDAIEAAIAADQPDAGQAAARFNAEQPPGADIRVVSGNGPAFAAIQRLIGNELAGTKAADVTDALSGQQWEELFSNVAVKEEANDLWRRARASGVTATALKHFTALAAASLKLAAGTDRLSEPTWEEEFRSVGSKEEANGLWRRAKASGVTAERLAELVGLATAALRWKTWTARMAAVTTKQEANAVYAEARARVAELGPDLVMSLIDVGKNALSGD